MSILFLIATLAGFALSSFHLLAALHLAGISLEDEVREAISALTSLISEASRGEFSTSFGFSDVEATLACNAAEIVVVLAVRDFTVPFLEGEWLIAFLALMIVLVFATEDDVV